MDPRSARTLWHRLEALNAVTYFSPECRDATAGLGLRGFWMGYFAARAAPLGPVGAGVVEATFYNFHPDRVRRAIPDAWHFAAPDVVVATRAEAAAAALRRILGPDRAEHLAATVVDDLHAAAGAGVAAGRPLFAANRDLPRLDDAVARLWQAATTLREHRGDGHVALLAGAGLDGCEAHVLAAGSEGGAAPELYLASRGWSEDEWAAAVDRLRERGLVSADGSITDGGRALRTGIERRTDELAIDAYEVLGGVGVDRLLEALEPAAAQVVASGEITFPNPMGLPRR